MQFVNKSLFRKIQGTQLTMHKLYTIQISKQFRSYGLCLHK